MSVGIETRVESSLSRDRVELVLDRLDRLPTLPSTFVRLLAVLGDDQSSAADVSRIIEGDPALTADVLRLVRRAEVGGTRGAATVAKAVALLGFRAVRNAALTCQFFAAFRTGSEDPQTGTRVRELWRHCIAVACAAELIAERCGDDADAGVAFVAGLLHDVGKIAIAACFPKSFARILDVADREPGCVCDHEQRVLGLDHTGVGRRLASRWGLEDEIVNAIWLHHQRPDLLPAGVSAPQYVRIVHLADGLVRTASIGSSGSRHAIDLDAGSQVLGLKSDDLRGLMENVPARMSPLCEAIGLESAVEPAEQIASLIEANQQLGRAVERLRGELESLRRRDRFARAAADLAAENVSGHSVASSCGAAAAALRAILKADRVLVWVGDPKRGATHVGVSTAGAGEPQASVVEDARCFQQVRTAPEGSIVSADESCRQVFLCCVGSSAAADLWQFGLGSDGCAGAIIEAAAERILPLRQAAEECVQLAQAVRSALRAAQVRCDAERMTQDVLDLNRRLAEMQSAAARDRSLSMIAAMAGGAAHELNNPLAVISGRAQMELAQASDPDRRRALEIIIEQSQKAAGIVTELMDFAKPAPPNPAQHPLAPTIERIRQHWCAASGVAAAQVRTSFADPHASVYCDAHQLQEILSAVLTNAAEATEPVARRIEINSRSLVSDDSVRLRVEDKGTGMTPAVLEHALDPFFSSRPAGRGRGLGLSKAYRLAEINGGRLWLESQTDRGTTVTIELPARPPTT